MSEVEITVRIDTDRIYDILSELTDAQTVALIKRLLPDLAENHIDDLENFIGRL